ncbi:MAG TPA: dihydrolipoamide acetyltransferase family protein [Jatrophihabitans sp.]|jgi:pyruvate dehydrogenase E2 component (dihydrolipoamide acetyltransferase)|uniref:dihydrolipoamide acetyltransferase family protein n=1 Tax=Jatrophihabitans sp. TaxID=1932789 RepID=UPI002E08D24F|nr:dihydrolipoamide acetyltransferase family protein [Jatrophihabitans sp.]
MPVKQFLLPDLGEGLTEGDILKWTVAVGDTVDVNDTIAEVETVKAAVELPSPFAGVVTALHADEGTTVPVGTPIISIDTGGIGTENIAAGEDMVPAVPGLPGEGAVPAEEKQLTLVGYGPREESGGRRRRRHAGGTNGATSAGAQVSFNLPPAPAGPEPAVVEPEPAPVAQRVLAKPPVRKLAKTLGVDLSTVTPTGPHGTVSREDVQAAVGTAAVAPQPQVDRSQRETRIPIKGVRKHTAAAMVSSAFTAPHVTEFITCDVTAMMELRDRVAARREFREVKVSPLLFVAKAVILAARKTPEINATWNEAAGEIVVKNYVNLGIAAATGRGLIVPNIKDADQLSLLDLARAIGALTDTARSGKTPPADMSGGTITITNVGVFGVDTGTPIINPGEAGIVAFGAIGRRPWVVGTGADERIEPRWVTQLAVSFDHRLVDGAQGSQFLADVAAVLTDPGLALL